jgi:hypothetical protein
VSRAAAGEAMRRPREAPEGPEALALLAAREATASPTAAPEEPEASGSPAVAVAASRSPSVGSAAPRRSGKGAMAGPPSRPQARRARAVLAPLAVPAARAETARTSPASSRRPVWAGPAGPEDRRAPEAASRDPTERPSPTPRAPWAVREVSAPPGVRAAARRPTVVLRDEGGTEGLAATVAPDRREAATEGRPVQVATGAPSQGPSSPLAAMAAPRSVASATVARVDRPWRSRHQRAQRELAESGDSAARRQLAQRERAEPAAPAAPAGQSAGSHEPPEEREEAPVVEAGAPEVPRPPRAVPEAQAERVAEAWARSVASPGRVAVVAARSPWAARAAPERPLAARVASVDQLLPLVERGAVATRRGPPGHWARLWA